MKKISLLIAAWMFAAPAWTASTEDLDQLLGKIDNDITAKRLSTPASNNALDKIEAFREAAPFDFRIVPLTYRWGEAYVALAKQALDSGKYDEAQGFLDKVWPVAALTPGLEDTQRAIDEARASGAAPVALEEPSEMPAAELERQRKLAEAAAREKERLKVEAEKQRQAEIARRQDEARKAAEEKALREQRERERRAALAEAKQQEAEQKKREAEARRQQAAAAKLPPVSSDIAGLDLDDLAAPVVPKPVPPKPVAKAKPKPKPANTAPARSSSAKATRLWNSAVEESAPLASYQVPLAALQEKNRNIADDMGDICQKMVDEDASVVIHTESRSDYRWLAVRLTLCGRRIDRGYRLRHSHSALSSGEAPKVTLHPPRESSLMEVVSE